MTAVLDPALANVSFPSLESIFDFISHKLGSEKLILVIDELPYWVKKDEVLLSVIQKYIDIEWGDKNIMIILCGSALSFMESKVLSEKSPLFGRRNSQIKLEAFNYKESALFVPDYSFEDKAICYGITGGVAKYLSMINPKKVLMRILKNYIFIQTDTCMMKRAIFLHRNLLMSHWSIM